MLIPVGFLTKSSNCFVGYVKFKVIEKKTFQKVWHQNNLGMYGTTRMELRGYQGRRESGEIIQTAGKHCNIDTGTILCHNLRAVHFMMRSVSRVSAPDHICFVPTTMDAARFCKISRRHSVASDNGSSTMPGYFRPGSPQQSNSLLSSPLNKWHTTVWLQWRYTAYSPPTRPPRRPLAIFYSNTWTLSVISAIVLRSRAFCRSILSTFFANGRF